MIIVAIINAYIHFGAPAPEGDVLGWGVDVLGWGDDELGWGG